MEVPKYPGLSIIRVFLSIKSLKTSNPPTFRSQQTSRFLRNLNITQLHVPHPNNFAKVYLMFFQSTLVKSSEI